MVVSEVIGESGKVGVAHVRYSDLYSLHTQLLQDSDNKGSMPRFPERSTYDVLTRVSIGWGW